MVKTVTEETRETCGRCGNRRPHVSTCRGCYGSGYVVTKTVTRSEELNVDDLADAVAEAVSRRVESRLRFLLPLVMGDPLSADAIDPSATDAGTPPTRETPAS